MKLFGKLFKMMQTQPMKSLLVLLTHLAVKQTSIKPKGLRPQL